MNINKIIELLEIIGFVDSGSCDIIYSYYSCGPVYHFEYNRKDSEYWLLRSTLFQ